MRWEWHLVKCELTDKYQIMEFKISSQIKISDGEIRQVTCDIDLTSRMYKLQKLNMKFLNFFESV